VNNIPLNPAACVRRASSPTLSNGCGTVITSTRTVEQYAERPPMLVPATGTDHQRARRTIVSAAVDLADRLVTMQHEFLRSVLQNVDDAVEKRSDKQK